MPKLNWLIRRLKAMSPEEVAWRLSQKALEKREQAVFGKERRAVNEAVFHRRLAALRLDGKRLCLNTANRDFALNTAIHLLGGADYAFYKTHWNAGFQTGSDWPDVFSYALDFKQRDEIGDARSNWELNRHFQFALLAKDYAASGERRYLEELEALFASWNRENPFLRGISWTSAMEIAIRSINWCYTYAFLSETDAPAALLEGLRVGILNMTDYVARHYSRYSSANNHLVVEAVSLGHSGILFDYRPWTELSLSILTRELGLQNYPDGVNKELSLHYQSFYMEAMGLMLRLLRKNALPVPPEWPAMLERMSCFVADCLGEHGEVIAFGDDDEGKILDLAGLPEDGSEPGHTWHYRYMLGMMSLLLERRYVDFDAPVCETLRWLFTPEDFAAAAGRPRYTPPQFSCYREGGNTILRSADGRLLIGIDHAALGYLSICAHAHADALSFQLFFDGRPVLVDPGTSLYHIDLGQRNAVRETRNHNTVCVGGQDQSEMLGAFLWGRRAACTLLEAKEEDGGFVLRASQDGYQPVIHTRSFRFDGGRRLVIEDTLSASASAEAHFLLGPGLSPVLSPGCAEIAGEGFRVRLRLSAGEFRQEAHEYAPVYGQLEPVSGVAAAFTQTLRTEIECI